MLKPPKILLYYIILLVAFGMLSYLIPQDGIYIGSTGIKLRWLSFNHIIQKDKSTLKDTVSKQFPDTILVQKLMKDSIEVNDSLYKKEKIIRDTISFKRKLVYPSSFRKSLYSFYSEIESADDSGKVIRILHMGDSQIEGDRITKYLRELFQKKFKGAGPGLVPLYDPQKQFPSVWISNKGAWSEHVVYNYPRLIKGNQYGIMGKVCKIDSIGESSVHISKSSMAQPSAARFYKSRLFLKNIGKPLTINAYWGRDLISTDSLSIDENLTEINWTFKSSPRKFSLTFESEKSPLFLGMSLDSLSGVSVDNISMRGQSSPRLDKTDTLLYKSMAEYMNIGMVILQYGTNMVPTITDDYNFYSVTYYRQLKILRQLMPNVPIVVVGVGDVAKLAEGKAVSYNHIAKIKEAQKRAAFKAGVAFFDLFEAMGGEGSMINWVNGEPKLAMSDYTHFNKPGGKKVADWIYEVIMGDYQNYKLVAKQNEIF